MDTGSLDYSSYRVLGFNVLGSNDSGLWLRAKDVQKRVRT